MLLRPARQVRLVVLLCLVGLASGCGASAATARTKALRTSLVALNVARDTARAVSKEREKQIIAACNPPTCTKEQGHADLDAWRATVDEIYQAIDDGYDAIWAAAILDDAKSVADAGAAVVNAVSLVKRLKPPVPAKKDTNKEATP